MASQQPPPPPPPDNEDEMMKLIVATHTPDGREIDVKPLLLLVENVLNRATTTQVETTTPPHMGRTEDETHQPDFIPLLDSLSYIIDRVSSEMECNCLRGTEGNQTALSLLNILSTYSWEAKAVLTLAAFALSYGEFWLQTQISSSNPLAKSMAILKQLPVNWEQSDPLKPQIDALNSLIKLVLDSTKCIVELVDLMDQRYLIGNPTVTETMAFFPDMVSWIIKSIVSCAIQITSFTGMGNPETRELSTFNHKIRHKCENLRDKLQICYRVIEEKKEVEAYELLDHTFEIPQIDNMNALEALLYASDDLQPLFDCSSKTPVDLDVLMSKNVLLLISSIDISPIEVSILEQIYMGSRQQMLSRPDSLYEVVWVPIVDHSLQWTESMQKEFEKLQSAMPWYTVHHPSLIGPAVIRFVREKWHFRYKPILVVLDPRGRVMNTNAINMMWTWGSVSFPFTRLREETLWMEETWRLELLVDGIDERIFNWIREGKYIFLYGGFDIGWIRKFTSTVGSIAQATGIPLEMVYVGKSTNIEKVQEANAIITSENLSHTWNKPMIWFFWDRLERMLLSKISVGGANVDCDPMMHELKKLLSYNMNGGWVMLSHGSNVVVNGPGTSVLSTLGEYDVWKERVAIEGFARSFQDRYVWIHETAHPCARFEFPNTIERIPASMKCPECTRNMEKFTIFNCCHDLH